MTTTHHLDIAGIRVELSLHEVTLKDFVTSCGHWVPAMCEVAEDGFRHLRVDVSVGVPALRYRRDGFSLRGDSGTFHTCLDAGVILSRYLERELNKRGRYSVHCAAIAYDGVAQVLLGPAGAGKTTLAAAAAMRDSRVQVLAGDRAVVEGDKVVGGTTTLHFRNGALRTHLRGLVEPLPDAEDMWERWTTKDFPTVASPVVSIGRLWVVRLGEGPARIGQVSPPDDVLRLIEQIAHFGEYFPCVALGHMQRVPIFTTAAVQRARIAYTRDVVAKVPVQTLSGGLDEIVDVLLEGAGP